MFDEMPDIIHTDIVSAAYDVFWNDLPNWIESLPKRKVMIITRPFEKGSPEAIQLSKIIAACKLEEDAYNCIHLPENVFLDRKSTRLNSSHVKISYAVFCLKKKKKKNNKRNTK